jgi:hypothetical protein
MKKNIFIALLLSGVFVASAQNNTAPDVRINEVYGSYTSTLNPEQLQWLKVKLERSQVILQPYAAGEALPKLSALKVVDKYIPGLQRDDFSRPEQINPLKYTINFHEKKDLVYRIDGTDYVLLIKKKS